MTRDEFDEWLATCPGKWHEEINESDTSVVCFSYYTAFEPESHWDNHEDYPPEDWQMEIANGDTRQSYVEWVNHKLQEEFESG
jgi:hypothetical protein